MHVLYEHAAGVALFRVKEFEDVGSMLPQVEESVLDLSRFNSIVKLVAFQPYKSAADALMNANSVSEGVLTEDLHTFLEASFPKSGKHAGVLGVIDPKLGAAISESLGISCQHIGVVPEIIRGIRLHFPTLVKGFSSRTSVQAQLALGHSYSRAKVKFNVNRADNMVIQSICLLDMLDKDVNTFSMRIREWYSYHFPELVKIVPDNYLYARTAKLVKNRKELTEDQLTELEEVLQDTDKAQAVIDASKSSMGMDISMIDLMNIERFASRVIALSEYRQQLADYLREKMTAVAPNLSTLIGEVVGARLISRAGSLTNLAKFPASTVQILGAEKALFRALKSRSNTPKYGLLYHSSFIGQAGIKNKGRISRYLANKCSIASRIDCFSEFPTTVYGTKLREQVEERLNFYETGAIPRKNVDVMKNAVKEAVIEENVQRKKQRKAEKRKKKKVAEEDAASTKHDDSQLNGEEPPTKKLKRSKSKSDADTDGDLDSSQLLGGSEKKKKKKKKLITDTTLESSSAVHLDTTTEADTSLVEDVSEVKRKKKKKKKSLVDTALDTTGGELSMDTTNEFDTSQLNGDGDSSVTKKKKKKKKKQIDVDAENE